MVDSSIDIGALNFARGIGQSKQEAAGDNMANTEESGKIIEKGLETAAGKLSSALLGMNLTSAGQIGVNQPFEYAGWADAKIPNLVEKLNARGGIIAQIAHTLVKNGVIQDQAQFQDLAGGVGGGDPLMANVGDFASPLPSEAPAPSGDRGGNFSPD